MKHHTHNPFRLGARLCAATSLLLTVAGAQAQDCRFIPPQGTIGKTQGLAQEAARSNPCATVPGLTAKSLSSVWSAFLSSGTAGGKRFDTVPPTGIPTGKVLASVEGVAFDLRAVLAESVQGIQVSAGRSPVYAIANPNQPVIVVPMNRLKPGDSYNWIISTRQNSYRGSFELLDNEEAADVQARLVALDKASLSPQMRLLYSAAVYDEAELYSARDQLLNQLRTQLAP